MILILFLILFFICYSGCVISSKCSRGEEQKELYIKKDRISFIPHDNSTSRTVGTRTTFK